MPLSATDPTGWASDDAEAALAAYIVSHDQTDCGWPRPSPGDSARSFFADAFDLGPAEGEADLLTGYYEPEFDAELRSDDRFRWPLYARPPGLFDGQVWHSRAEIAAGDLLAGHEIAWLADPLDAYLAQVQGSVRLWLGNGSVLRLGYAGRNGHPYRSIGAELVARGVTEPAGMTLDVIRAWARTHPDDLPSLMLSNPSFVVFRVLDLPETSGPLGAHGRPLTAGRSLAADPGFVPAGAPVWVTALGRLMVAQDSGSAIRGRNRGDVFCGTGDAAGTLAGRLRLSGHLRVLRPRPGPRK